jgi:hypothetical protein
VSAWQRWYWIELLLALDAAGYAIVKKPELLDRGVPT